MQADGLQGVSRRKGTTTTIRSTRDRPAPDLVERDFTADAPNGLWVADITYIATAVGFLYLAVVLDAFSRRIVGWSKDLRTELVLAALEMALDQRKPDGVIHHSDQGCQSIAFGARCRVAGVRPSMGSVGDCYDNAMCERFFATLECELPASRTLRDAGRGPDGHLRVHRRVVLPWQRPQPERLTPERVKQSIGGHFVAFGTPARAPQRRGTPSGWPKGKPRKRRERHRVVRKPRKKRAKGRKAA